MIKKLTVFIILIVSMCFSIQMEIEDIKVVGSNSNKIYPGDTVNIYFLIKNDDIYNYSDVKIYFYPYYPLKKRYTYLNELKFDKFYSGQEKILRFSFKVPNNVKPGDYEVKLEFQGDNGEKIKEYDQKFYIKVFSHNYFDINLSNEKIKNGILNLKLKIKSLYPAKHTVVSIIPEGFDIVGNNEFYLGDFDRDEIKEVPLKFYISDVPTGVYKVKTVIRWIGLDEREKTLEKEFNVFIDNKKEKNFEIICNKTNIEKGLNKIFCKILKIKNYKIKYITFPNYVIGQKTTNKTEFNITINADKIGNLNFCPITNYIGEDLKNHEEEVCFTFNVVDPVFQIEIETTNKTINKDKINLIKFKILSNKKLEHLKIDVFGEIVGNSHFENKKEFYVLIKPENKNYVKIKLTWRYKGKTYEKDYFIYFNVREKIEKDQLYVFYDKSKNILGVANRGKFKLYHCVLNITNNKTIIKTKYIGDLDEDDYDSTDLSTIHGKVLNISVQCYDKDHKKIFVNKLLHLPQKISNQKNSSYLFCLFIAVCLMIIAVIIVKKRYKKD